MNRHLSALSDCDLCWDRLFMPGYEVCPQCGRRFPPPSSPESVESTEALTDAPASSPPNALRPDEPPMPTVESFTAPGRAGVWMFVASMLLALRALVVYPVIFEALHPRVVRAYPDSTIYTAMLIFAGVMFGAAVCLQHRSVAFWAGVGGCVSYLFALESFRSFTELSCSRLALTDEAAWGMVRVPMYALLLFETVTTFVLVWAGYSTFDALSRATVRREFRDIGPYEG